MMTFFFVSFIIL